MLCDRRSAKERSLHLNCIFLKDTLFQYLAFFGISHSQFPSLHHPEPQTLLILGHSKNLRLWRR
ncbi:MAG: hypothetical protein V7K32_12975 [Nostoc sp.]